MREGSVAVGSQLEDPRYRLQLEQTSRPPVPTFPGLSSSVGKRPSPVANEPSLFLNGAKRAKHIEIPETHLEEQEQDLVSSIEHDEPQGSIELVQGTQYSNLGLDNAGHQSLDKPKDESPALRNLSQNKPPPTSDGHEHLPEEQVGFVSNKGKEVSTNINSPFRFNIPHQPLPSPTETAEQFKKLVRGPITPPSETSGKQSNPTSLQQRRSEDATKSAAQLSSTSSNKFKRNDIYDYPESEIDDSQMSPRSRQGKLSHRKSKDQLSRIESLESPQDDRENDQGLSISQAIGSLEDGSDFEDDRPVDQSLRTSENASRKASSGSGEATEASVYEDPESEDSEDLEQDQDKPSRRASSKAASDAPQTNNGKGTKPVKPAAAQSQQHRVKPAENKVEAKANGIPKDHRASPTPSNQAIITRNQKRSRNRKRMRDASSVDGDARSSVNRSDNGTTYSDAVNTMRPALKDEKVVKKAKTSRGSTSLDSPGEQLSQSLQRSTEELPLKAVNRKLTSEQKQARSGTPGKGNKAALSKASAKKPTTTSLSSLASNSKVEKEAAVVAARSPQPSIVLQHAEQEVGSPPALTKPLPNWGSETPIGPAKKKPATSNKEDSLKVDQQDESRKSPSVGLGLTAEELKTMESRKDMTQEEYAAEKKRKKQETEKQRKRPNVVKKDPTTEDAATKKAPTAKNAAAEEHKPATASTKNKARKSLSSEEGPKASLQRSATDSSVATSGNEGSKSSAETSAETSSSGKAKAMRRESTGASSSQASKADSMAPPKTPAKAAKSPSVKSASNSKTAKPAQQPKADKTSSQAPSKTPSVKSAASNKTSKPNLQTNSSSQQSKPDKAPNAVAKKAAPSVPTSVKSNLKVTAKPQAKTSQATPSIPRTLTELRKDMHSRNMGPETNKGSLLSQIKQTQKPSGFQLDDDDDEDDESDSSDDEEVRPKVSTKVVAVTKLVATPIQKKPAPEDEDEEDSSEEEIGNKAKKALNGRSLPSSGAKGKVSSQPDPSIRDQSVESDDDDDEDEDDS